MPSFKPNLVKLGLTIVTAEDESYADESYALVA